jgi:hypothetical protein
MAGSPGRENRCPRAGHSALQQRVDAKPMAMFINATVSGGFRCRQRYLESSGLYVSGIGQAWHGLRS